VERGNADPRFAAMRGTGSPPCIAAPSRVKRSRTALSRTSEATVDILLSLRSWKSRATHRPVAVLTAFAGLSRAILISALPKGELDRNARER